MPMQGTPHSTPLTKELPEGLTLESVFYAIDGPKEQVMRDLLAIRDALYLWDTDKANQLRNEVEEAIEERS